MPNQPRTLNERLSTPNKLFECLAAGVPVVVSDFPAVRAIVLDDQLGPLGATTDPADPRAVARAIGTLLDLGPGERSAIRRRCARAARERWNWESEVAGLVEAYRHLANPTDRAPRAEAPSHEGGV
jgi:glycosyltransferase involved in cell wall biosynthesis